MVMKVQGPCARKLMASSTVKTTVKIYWEETRGQTVVRSLDLAATRRALCQLHHSSPGHGNARACPTTSPQQHAQQLGDKPARQGTSISPSTARKLVGKEQKPFVEGREGLRVRGGRGGRRV